MAKHAILRFEDGAAPTWSLRLPAGGPERLGSLAELAASASDDCVVLLDAAGLLLTEVELPTANERIAHQAIPFALEERLLQPVEELHFAHRSLGGGLFAVAVVERQRLEDMLLAIEQAGCRPLMVGVDALALPFEPDTWSLLLAGGSAWLRMGPYSACRVPHTQLRSVLTVEAERRPVPARLIVFDVGPGLTIDLPASMSYVVIERFDVDSPSDCMQAGFDPAGEIELTPPDRRAALGRPARNRLLLVAASLLLITAVVHAGLGYWRTEQIERSLSAQRGATEARFRELFPDATRVVDVRAQATARLAEAEKGYSVTAPFLDLFATFNRTLTKAAVPGVELQSVAYADGAMDLKILASDVASVDTVRRALQSEMAGVELVSAENGGDRVTGILRMKPLSP